MENMYRLRVNTWFKTSEQGMQAMILHVDMHVISLSMFEPSMVIPGHSGSYLTMSLVDWYISLPCSFENGSTTLSWMV